jgi:peptidoglycan/LPS O-acetylase OafA/YrhL
MTQQPQTPVELPLEPAADPAVGRQPAPSSRWDQPRHADGSYVAVARRELRALTSLRFFAALYVVVHHLVNIGLLHSQGENADREATWYLAWATQGHVGVTFFFVLSGFILAWCYHRAFSVDDGEQRSASRRKFWIARFARVWPLHAAMFAVFVPLAVLDVGASVGGLATTAWQGALNLLLLHAWIPFGGPDGLADTFNAPSWTLSVEALFYLAFPGLAALLVQRLRWGTAQLALLGAAAWLALGSLAMALAGSERGEWVLRVFPPARLPDFVIGVVLGLIVVQGLQRATLAGAPDRDHASTGWTLLEGALLALACLSPLVWALAASKLLPATMGTSWFHLPTIAAAIYVVSLERGSISRRLLAARPLVWLGEVSYALYLVHLFIVLAAYRVGVYDILGTWVTSLLLVVTSIAVAGLVHERFEKRARSWIIARAGRRS